MALVFEQILTAALGDASYLVGDGGARECAVVDPQIDIDRIVAVARGHGLAIRHVVQTHVHEDFASGAAALAQACGATLWVGTRESPAYGFVHRAASEGATLRLGDIVLTVRETPGHTPEHIALLLAKADDAARPFAVLSGGSLLAGTAGRTDLLGPGRADELTRAQFDSLRRVFLSLDDGVLVYPTHVHGSPCGAAIGDRLVTSIGYERRHNALLRHADPEDFRRAALAGLPPKPTYYPRLKSLNTSGAARPPDADGIRALTPREFEDAARDASHLVLDTRHLLAFGAGHVPGAVNIGAHGHFAIQAGWMLDPVRPLLLVVERDADVPQVATELARTGLTRIAAYLAGGMSAWADAGGALASIEQMHVRELAQAVRSPDSEGILPLDVRTPGEWSAGRVPGARHIFLPDLPRELASLPRERRIAVYCDSGYRASIAASLLAAHGLDVVNVPGSWQAWTACGLPVEK